MNRSRLAFLSIALLYLALVACSKVEYDFKALGFADKPEMEAAFAKGYHTKQKFNEMSPNAAASTVFKALKIINQ